MEMEKLQIKEVRKELCLNGIWDFKCEVDEEFTTINVPSSYSILSEGKWDKYYWDSFDYPKEWSQKSAIYRRSFIVPTEMKGMNIRFCCEGSSYHTRVLINGNFIGESHDGYYPFEFDIDAVVNEGENILEVMVAALEGDTLGGETMANRGIWKNTYLKAYSKLSVEI